MSDPVTDDAAAFDLERSGPLGPAKGSGTPTSKVRPVESVSPTPPQTPSTKRQRKVHLVVPETSFDLLEGTYASMRRARLGAVLAVGVLLVALILVVADAFTSVIAKYGAEAQVTNLELGVQDQVQALAKLTTVDGASGSEMRKAIVIRAGESAQATEMEVDVRTLLSDITLSMPIAARWSSISFDAPTQVAAPAEAAPSETDTAPAVTTSRVEVTIKGTVPSYEVASLWITNLRKIEYLTDQSVGWNGDVPSIAFSMTAYIDSAGTKRYETFVDDVTAVSDEQAATTAPAATTTTDATTDSTEPGAGGGAG